MRRFSRTSLGAQEVPDHLKKKKKKKSVEDAIRNALFPSFQLQYPETMSMMMMMMMMI